MGGYIHQMVIIVLTLNENNFVFIDGQVHNCFVFLNYAQNRTQNAEY